MSVFRRSPHHGFIDADAYRIHRETRAAQNEAAALRLLPDEIVDRIRRQAAGDPETLRGLLLRAAEQERLHPSPQTLAKAAADAAWARARVEEKITPMRLLAVFTALRSVSGRPVPKALRLAQLASYLDLPPNPDRQQLTAEEYYDVLVEALVELEHRGVLTRTEESGTYTTARAGERAYRYTAWTYNPDQQEYPELPAPAPLVDHHRG